MYSDSCKEVSSQSSECIIVFFHSGRHVRLSKCSSSRDLKGGKNGVTFLLFTIVLLALLGVPVI